MNKNPIGVLDSGIGGLSTLSEMAQILPNENFIFYADHKNAPYGVKSSQTVVKYVFDVVDYLLKQDIKALVLACNTATSVAVNELRQNLNIPVIGIEPALKVAVDSKTNKKIIVMATPLTIKEKKFNDLCNRFKDDYQIDLFPANGLVEIIEKDDKAGISDYLLNLFSNINKEDYSHIVLGCTHYIFIKSYLYDIFGKNINLVDGNKGISLNLKKILTENQLLNSPENKQQILFHTSGNKEDFEKLSVFFELSKSL